MNRKKQYQAFLSAARNQSTDWLKRCAAEPSNNMLSTRFSGLSRLAVRAVLRERIGCAFQDISHVTEYGVTSRLQRVLRVF